MNIQIKVDHPTLMPFRAHPSDAGADLRSNSDYTLYPGEMTMIDTGAAIAVPEGFVGLVYNRSSQGKIKVSIPHSVGVIDSLYRGNIKVILHNQGDDPYTIKKYDTRIAQLVITPIVLANFVEVESLESTDRGVGGFGSTGV